MVPLFNPNGHLVKVNYISSLENLKRFDVIVFWQNNILVCHYYWKNNSYFNDPANPTFMTRPLNPIKNFDHPIQFEHILGKVDQELSRWLKFKILLNTLFN